MTLPKPYYDTDLGKLYLGDCLEIMPHLEKVSLILTDPPYGINVAKTGKVGIERCAKNQDYGASDWDKRPPPDITFDLMRDKSINQIIFGGNYFRNLPPSSCWLVWDKDNGLNPFADCELVYTSFNFAVRKIRWKWQGMLKEHPEKRYHITQKPAGLIAWILDKYGQDSHSVMDPFLGSGTTAIACERLNRRWIGIEIEEKYCAIAKKRIEQERKQLKLF